MVVACLVVFGGWLLGDCGLLVIWVCYIGAEWLWLCGLFSLGCCNLHVWCMLVFVVVWFTVWCGLVG